MWGWLGGFCVGMSNVESSSRALAPPPHVQMIANTRSDGACTARDVAKTQDLVFGEIKGEEMVRQPPTPPPPDPGPPIAW